MQLLADSSEHAHHDTGGNDGACFVAVCACEYGSTWVALICQAPYHDHMARRAGPKLRFNRKIIDQMEGLRAEFKTGERPTLDPAAWVMMTCKVSLSTVQYWARERTSKGLSPPVQLEDLYEDFARTYGELQATVAEKPLEVIHGVMNNTAASPTDRLKAAKWAIEHIWPERYGSHAKPVQIEITSAPAADSDVVDIPIKVYDEMTDDEVLEFEKLQAEIDARKSKAEALLESVRGRVSTVAEVW